MAHKCLHCGMEHPISAHICPYCGEDPYSFSTKAERAQMAYNDAVKRARKKARRDAGIEKHGFLGYYFRKLLLWGAIIIGLMIIANL